MFTVENMKDCFDLLEDGLIVVDKNKIIQVYNRRAQDIFGLKEQSGPGHPAGKIAKGDIVILGDTCLGADDGELTPQDLEAGSETVDLKALYRLAKPVTGSSSNVLRSIVTSTKAGIAMEIVFVRHRHKKNEWLAILSTDHLHKRRSLYGYPIRFIAK